MKKVDITLITCVRKNVNYYFAHSQVTCSYFYKGMDIRQTNLGDNFEKLVFIGVPYFYMPHNALYAGLPQVVLF